MNFFEKDNYQISDIQELINSSAEEAINLDFKEAGSLDSTDNKKKEIGKDVSAFANSAGGIIVYGLSEANHVATSFSFVDGNRYTKEWLESVINSNIHGRIDGLKIFPLRNQNRIEETIYVVKIPESDNAPHMNKDNRYYKRFNFQSVPMEEYEVRHLYNRIKNSILDFESIKITGGHLHAVPIDDFIKGEEGISVAEKIASKNKMPPYLKNIGYDLSILVKNVGKIPEDKFQLHIECPMHSLKGKPDSKSNLRNIIKSQPYKILSERSTLRDLITVPSYSNIFPNEITELWKCSIYFNEISYDAIKKNSIIKMILYYSNGHKNLEIDLKKALLFNGKVVTESAIISW